MKQKILITVAAVFLAGLLCGFIDRIFFWSFLIAGISLFILLVVFLRCNALLRATNGYRNLFIYTSQFVSNVGYREELQRNYEIVNLGSNPARFAFFYENVRGQNWSTGLQGLDQDLEILRYFHSYIRKDGIVLLPIVAFSSVSSYLKPDAGYIDKFASFLDRHQIQESFGREAIKAFRRVFYPILYQWKSARYLFHDVEKDNRLACCEQPMQAMELIRDAQQWMQIWKEEFAITDLEAPLSPTLKEGRKKSVEDLQKIIDFCLERRLKPVLIFPPMTNYLTRLFSETVRETYIYSFIREANVKNIPFLDYLDDSRFTDSSLYFNSFFLNLRGRTLFTAQILEDLKKVDKQ
jgi:hypothetical protein